jgi:leader peptidase (prepilin peptidase) / N-methyltransferase
LPAVVLIAAFGGLAQVAVQMMLAIRTDGSLAFGPWLAVGFFSLWIAKMWHGDVLVLTAF